MMRLLEQFPLIKWILIICGILYVLDKYFGIIDIVINLIFGDNHSGTLEEDLNDIQLKKVVQEFKNRNFDEVELMFTNFSSSYRTHAFSALGALYDTDITDQWISKQINSALPQTIKASQLIAKAWKVRGTGTIDTVSESSLKTMKDYLYQAKEILLDAKQQTSDYVVNINVLLLKLYKAIDVDRTEIHTVFNESQIDNTNHVGLNYHYFVAISRKWGGNLEELDLYFESLSEKTKFINQLIFAQYYFDLVYMFNYKDKDGKIKQFLNTSKDYLVDADQLYRAKYYQLMYWTSSSLNQKELTKHYKSLVLPYLIKEE